MRMICRSIAALFAMLLMAGAPAAALEPVEVEHPVFELGLAGDTAMEPVQNAETIAPASPAGHDLYATAWAGHTDHAAGVTLEHVVRHKLDTERHTGQSPHPPAYPLII